MIPVFKVNMSPAVSASLEPVFKSGMIGEGPQVTEFTGALKGMFGNPYVVAVNSCTSALVMALRLAGIGMDCKVLTTPFTMIATNCAVAESGADIVWGEVDRETLCLDLDMASESLEHVDAVVVTLVGGMVPRNLEPFLEEAARWGVPVIADAAHALMTTYKGRHISRYFDYCCFSFQSIKHLTTGDGGAITCHSLANYRRAEKLKWFGMTREVPEGKTRLEHQMTSQVPEWGYKFHMNDIAATIGLCNIDPATDAVRASCENAEYYMNNLAKDRLFTVVDHSDPSWWVFPIRTNYPDTLMQRLAENEIASTPLWPINTIHTCFNYDEELSTFDINYFQQPLCIPNGFWVTPEDRQKIVDVINESYID